MRISVLIVREKLHNPEQATCHQCILKELIKSIHNSGDGESPATAFIVISIAEAYFLLERISGLQVQIQVLVEEQGHWYDKITGVDSKTNKSLTLYFNIDRPYRWLTHHGK